MNKGVDSPSPETTCFVICPIGEPDSDVRKKSDLVLRHIIAPAAKDNNLVPLRSDEISTPGMITTQIIRHILNDRMVVADLSSHNANVFYELGLRHAFRKPVVQTISADEPIPFDVHGARTVHYRLDELDSVANARTSVSRQMAAALSKEFEVESPVTTAARLEDLLRDATPETQLMESVLSQLDSLQQSISEMSQLVCRPEDIKEAIPPRIQDEIGSILRQYAEEIDLLKSVRYAGVVGIYKRREMAIQAFSRAIDQETRDIMIIGSSLKGLLQRDEYAPIAEKLRFKLERGLVRIKFLLTHPIVADFRASQENRRPTEIGLEIITSLEQLRDWGVRPEDVRLYLGTPTCFAVKTTRRMLINPYPYISVSYDSPCLILEYSSEGGSDRPGYFFDEFNSRHFGAWETDLAVHVSDFDQTISQCREMLGEYAENVESLLARGKALR